MKLSSTAIKELSAQYRSVLKKCFILNACVLMAASPAMATTLMEEPIIIAKGETKTFDDYEMKNKDVRAFKNEGVMTLSNSNIEGNTASGTGIILNTNIATISNTALTNNASLGGAVANYYGKLTVSDSSFTGNSSLDSPYSAAGAISAHNNGIVDIDNTSFTENTASKKSQAGAIYLSAENVTDGSTIDNSKFTKNKVISSDKDAAGGAIIFAQDKLTIQKTDFKENESDNAGAIAIYSLGGHEEYTNRELTINSSTFTQNKAKSGEGGAIAGVGSINIDDTTFTSNTATGNGGAISNSGDLTITDSEFEGNKATGASSLGGAIYANNATETIAVSITDSEFEENSAYAGGAIFSGKNVDLTITGGEFEDNTADWGGAVYTGTESGLTKISGTTFKNNSALSAGAVELMAKGELTDVTFTGNKATAQDDGAGALFLGAVSQTTITGGLFSANESATTGGAIAMRDTTKGNNTAAKLDISGTVFDGNIAATQGGAIYSTFYNSEQKVNNVAITGATFTNNQANEGGAIYNEGQADVGGNKAAMYIENSTFTGNTAKTNGGAIYSTGTVTINDAEFIGNKAESSYAGAIYNGQTGKITIENSIFKNNLAHNGGALIAGKTTTGTTIKNSTFENNTADAFGAVGLFKLGELENVTFTANKATSAKMNINNGAGALFLGAESVVKITNGSFNQNESATSGGAIAMRATDVANNSAAKLDIIGTTFDGNIAATQGGAIYSTFYNSEQKVNNVAITGATFTNNQANEGGAIYNEGQADVGGNKAAMYIENSTFTGNTAKTNGGALFVAEGGTVELAGTNTFSGNKAGNALNDIHNNGTLNVSGALTLDGGITGTGSVVFADNTSLTAALKNSTIVANSVEFIGDNVVLNLTNIAAGTYDLIDASISGNFKLSDEVLNNAVFDITQNGDKITAETKSSEAIADNLGVSEDTAQVIGALGQVAANNEKAQAALNIIANTDTPEKVREKIVENINPTSTPVVQSVATEVNGQIMNLVGARLAPATGRAAGDYKIEAGGVWAKGLYSRTKQDGAFRGYTQGIAMGIDSVIDDVLTVGIGYAYNNTDIKADARKTNVKGHNFFAYGEYQPSEWFVNGALSYSKSDYEEQRQLSGNGAEYTVETYGAQAMAGYDFANGLTPQAGLRYLHVTQDSHTDAFGGYISAEATDLLTAVAGINYAKDFATEKVTFTPEVRLAATYDMVSDGAKVNVIMGDASYTVKGDRLPRFGVEAGLGLQMNIADSVDVNVDYDLAVRRDYTSHTGTVSLKYNF